MNSLQVVDFVDAANQPLDGLVSVRAPSGTNRPDERSVLDQAKAFKHIDYVYFRRFSAEHGTVARSSQVAAYVIDNPRKKRLTAEALAELHHELWLHAVAPLVYVAWPTRVDILSCARKPDFWDESGNEPVCRYSPAESIEIAGEISDEMTAKRLRLSAYRLADGTFWDEPENQKLAREDASAHRSLIQAIVDADRKLDGANKPIRRRLLVLMVLIKYLEDRRVLPPDLFEEFRAGARSILDVLRQGNVEDVARLLRYFERKFNGDVFSLGDGNFDLETTDLRHVAELVEGKTLGNQKHFWELFRFEHIPAEVISRLYQRFVRGHGAVYTPPFLAALLLDQVMPFESMTGKETVLDPACGSGVFLVGAFKRLVAYWRSQNDWKKPTPRILKEILSRSIHGIEMESSAVDLTAFSLALAICDSLLPPVIWKTLRFDRLRGRNLREGDFFDPATTADRSDHSWRPSFDVIVGNPPFGSKLTPAAKSVNSQRPVGQPRLPDNQIAYLFLEQCLRRLSSGGSLCLLQPHGLLYNRNPARFRRHLMGLARLDTVLDFVSIRGMFEDKDPKALAWHAIRDDEFHTPIIHLTFRRTFSSNERLTFEIDHYDRHEISREQGTSDPFVWRSGLFGGGRVGVLSERLRRATSLKDFVLRLEWEYGEGYIAATRGRRTPASFLTGMKLLPSSAFRGTTVDLDAVSTVEETEFRSAYGPLRYSAPLLLIKKHMSVPFVVWNSGDIAYKAQIVGIHPTKGTEAQFRWLVRQFETHRRTLRFAMAINGTRGGTAKATAVEKQDIDILPIPNEGEDLSLNFWEQAIRDDVIDYLADYVRLGNDSALMSRAAESQDLLSFATFYVRMLGSLYRELRAADPVFLKNGLIAQPFYFGQAPDVSWLADATEASLRRLVYEKTSESLRTVRVVRYYEGNVILIIKPDRLRYWIKSTAIRDADDTLVELIRDQGW